MSEQEFIQSSGAQGIQGGQEEEGLNIKLRDVLGFVIRRWYLFAISAFVCVAVASLYILRTPKVYQRTACLVIKSSNKGQSVSNADFSNIGLIATVSTVNDEIKALGSKSNMTNVVQRLNLCNTYSVKGHFHDHTLYASSLPITVEVPEISDMQTASFLVSQTGEDTFVLKEFVLKGDKLSKKLKVPGAFGDTLQTPVGPVIVTKTHYFPEKGMDDVRFSKSSLHSTVSRFSGELTVALSDKQSNVIMMTVKDILVQRAEDILNTLINVYNENWIKDKNLMAISTSRFIEDRLAVIEKELSNVDGDISDYRSRNMLSDESRSAALYLEQNNAISNQVMELNNQLSITKFLKNMLVSTTDKTQLLPVNSGISSSSIESLLKEYNTRVLERNNLLSATSNTNPLVVELDEILDKLFQAIMSSIDNEVLALNTRIQSLQKSASQMSSKISASPEQARHLQSLERQQIVKQSLYLFLLQKREENDLTQAFTAYNTRIIDPPYGPMAPVAPKSRIIILIALILGLGIPLVVWYIVEMVNTTVRGREDINALTIPFVGEIPLAEPDKNARNVVTKLFKGKSSSNWEERKVVVSRGSRNVINEAFRVLRTNLEFMDKDGKGTVISVTSYNPGSGKSFITFNTAISLAIRGKKVLVIDGDLRHASVSQYVNKPKTGLSDVLSGRVASVADVIVTHPEYPELKVISAGTIPPNPTELIADARFAQVIDEVRGDFDYVFIDCPPLGMMADAQIISRSADRMMFIIRAGLFERSMLAQLQETYDENRYKGMCTVLNGTNQAGKGYRYSYRYAYRYGYKDGYHYSHYGDE